MKNKTKFVTVTPVCKKTGNVAPSITTSIESKKHLKSEEQQAAIREAKTKSRLSDFDNWRFIVN